MTRASFSHLHEGIGARHSTLQHLLRYRIIEMMETQVEHSTLLTLPVSHNPHRLGRINRLLHIPHPALRICPHKFPPRFDIRPQIRQHEIRSSEPPLPQQFIHPAFNVRCGPPGPSAGIHIGVLACGLQTTELVYQHGASLFGGGTEGAGDGQTPGSGKRFVGVLAEPGRAPGLVLHFSEVEAGEQGSVKGEGFGHVWIARFRWGLGRVEDQELR